MFFCVWEAFYILNDLLIYLSCIYKTKDIKQKHKQTNIVVVFMVVLVYFLPSIMSKIMVMAMYQHLT
jgi:hypothetical protein